MFSEVIILRVHEHHLIVWQQPISVYYYPSNNNKSNDCVGYVAKNLIRRRSASFSFVRGDHTPIVDPLSHHTRTPL